jgi:hypothetical protein
MQERQMMLGPISTEPSSPWLLIVFGAAGMVFAWAKYLTGNLPSRSFPGDNRVQLAFATTVLGYMIGQGVWFLIH